MGWLIAFVFVFVVVLAPVVYAGLLRRQILDMPNQRSSHSTPVPRGGGIAPCIGILAGLASPVDAPGALRMGLIVAVVGFGVLGLAEDIRGVSAMKRLIGQVFVAVAVAALSVQAYGYGPQARIMIGVASVVWLVGLVNAFNFMDGINGVSVAQTVVAGSTWVVAGAIGDVPFLTAGGAVVAVAALAFLPYNFPRARMFLGDVGSYALGGALAFLAQIGVVYGLPPAAVLAPLGLYLADTSSTLMRRIWRHEQWSAPHRDHCYQRLVDAGWSHVKVTSFVLVVLVACGVLGLLTFAASIWIRVAALVTIGVTLVGYLFTPWWVSRRQACVGSAG